MEVFPFSGFAEFGHQKKNSCQTLLAGIEKLIDKIGLSAYAACQEKFHEEVGEHGLVMHYASHLFPGYLERRTRIDGRGRRQTWTRN